MTLTPTPIGSVIFEYNETHRVHLGKDRTVYSQYTFDKIILFYFFRENAFQEIMFGKPPSFDKNSSILIFDKYFP